MSEETPRRTIRIPNHRWQAAKTRADDQGTTISEVVNNYLEEYGHPMNPPGTQQQPMDDDKTPEPWDNELGCCRYNVTEGGVHTHGGPDCIWPGTSKLKPQEQLTT